MALAINSRSVAEIDVRDVGVRSIVGAYELIFPLSINVYAEEGSNRLAVIAGARVSVKSHGAPQRPMGFARPDAPITMRLHSSPNHMTPNLSLILQPEQVLALEEMRAGGDLNFELMAVSEGFDGENWHQIQDTWHVAVPQSNWIEKIRSAGILDILLLEIPMPVGELSEEWGEIGEHLIRAQKNFVSGEYFSCVAQCRFVVSEVGRMRFGEREAWAVRPLERMAQDRGGMTKGEREAAIYAVLRHYTHQAHHSKSEGGEAAYTRSEAKMILSQTAALVAHARGV